MDETAGVFLLFHPRLCGTRSLQPYTERLFLLSSTTTVVMTSEVSLTGPGLQLHYTVFNLSDRKLEARDLKRLRNEDKLLCNHLMFNQCVCVSLCCFKACPGQFFCSTNGLCVSACDGIKDCPNGLDERNCGIYLLLKNLFISSLNELTYISKYTTFSFNKRNIDNELFLRLFFVICPLISNHCRIITISQYPSLKMTNQ